MPPEEIVKTSAAERVPPEDSCSNGVESPPRASSLPDGLADQVRDLALLLRYTSRRLRRVETFLDAVRREAHSSPVLRWIRRWILRPSGAVRRRAGAPWQEDYLRVYSETEAFDPQGQPRAATEHDRRNFLNHLKFYRFAAQFAHGQAVLDVGCGSGYGCRELARAGAAEVHGCDLSDHALDYARRHHGEWATFTRQSCTTMRAYPDGRFDLVVCSEVLEHLRETGEEEKALREMQRVARPSALFVLATPNEEMLPEHGFEFGSLRDLCQHHFEEFLVFENLLMPFTEAGRMRWLERRLVGETGLLAQAEVRIEETVLPERGEGGETPRLELKPGPRVAEVTLGPYVCDARRLHNTHSFVVLAVRPRRQGKTP